MLRFVAFVFSPVVAAALLAASAVSGDDVSSLLPLGGASVLLIYLLRIWMVEQRRWGQERAQLIAEHRSHIADREAEFIRDINRLRARVAELEADNDRLRSNL